MSYSGLKTALRTLVDKEQKSRGVSVLPHDCMANMAASFQFAALNHLLDKTELATAYILREGYEPRHMVLCGGVARNESLRSRLSAVVELYGLKCKIPPPLHCTDNAIMIGWTAIERELAGKSQEIKFDYPESDFYPKWPVGKRVLVSAARNNTLNGELFRLGNRKNFRVYKVLAAVSAESRHTADTDAPPARTDVRDEVHSVGTKSD